MSENKKIPDNQITVYQTSEGKINIEVLYSGENIWLPQKRMAELFGCSADNISLHLKNINKEKELVEISTTEDFSVVQVKGKREVTRNVTCYSLEAISHEVTLTLAQKEYESFKKEQDRRYISDFDEEVRYIAGIKDEN